MVRAEFARVLERELSEAVEALEQISEWLIRPNDYELNAARNIARAAIAKATGNQS